MSDQLQMPASDEVLAILGAPEGTPADPPPASTQVRERTPSPTPDGEGGQQQQPRQQGQQPAQPDAGRQPGTQLGLQPSELQTLRERVAFLEGQGQVRQPTGQGQGQEQPDPFGQVPDYAWNVPDAILTGMSSEDPQVRRQALGTLLQGVSRGVHTLVMNKMKEIITQGVPGMVQMMLNQHQQQQTVAGDFYGTHKDLSHPGLRPVVVEVAKRYFNQPGVVQTWSPQARDAIANKVREELGFAPIPQRRNGGVPAPATLMNGSGGGAGRVPEGRPWSMADDINSTLQDW